MSYGAQTPGAQLSMQSEHHTKLALLTFFPLLPTLAHTHFLFTHFIYLFNII